MQRRALPPFIAASNRITTPAAHQNNRIMTNQENTKLKVPLFEFSENQAHKPCNPEAVL